MPVKVVRVAMQMVAAVAERGKVEEETVMKGAVMVLAAEVQVEAALVAAVMAMVVAATVMEEIEGKRLVALEEEGKRVEVASAVGVAAMASEAAGRLAADKVSAGVVAMVKSEPMAAVEGALEGVWTALEEMETAPAAVALATKAEATAVKTHEAATTVEGCKVMVAMAVTVRALVAEATRLVAVEIGKEWTALVEVAEMDLMVAAVMAVSTQPLLSSTCMLY